MKALPLVPTACGLTPTGLDAQRARAEAVRGAVREVRRTGDELVVSFGPTVDEAVVRELVEVERGCCSFLSIGYEGRELRVGASDAAGREVLDLFTTIFSEAA